MWMEHDLETLDPPPAFLYHLGDVVYFDGERNRYYDEFYDPYLHYLPPIFAIPGNHDGDLGIPAVGTSLEGFMVNFCAVAATVTPDARDVPRPQPRSAAQESHRSGGIASHIDSQEARFTLAIPRVRADGDRPRTARSRPGRGRRVPATLGPRAALARWGQPAQRRLRHDRLPAVRPPVPGRVRHTLDHARRTRGRRAAHAGRRLRRARRHLRSEHGRSRELDGLPDADREPELLVPAGGGARKRQHGAAGRDPAHASERGRDRYSEDQERKLPSAFHRGASIHQARRKERETATEPSRRSPL